MKYVYLILAILLVPLVNAIPEIPHQFYGSVTNDGGTVIAKLCNVQFNVPIVNNQYGLSFPLLVSREDCSNTNIEFFVDGYKIGDYTYVSGGYTRLDLTVPVINNPPIDNPLINTQNTNDNTQTNDNNVDDDSNDGRERDTSHIRPAPDDLVFDSDNEEQGSVGNSQATNQISTGKAIYNKLTKTKLGITSISIIGVISLLGLIYLLKLVIF